MKIVVATNNRGKFREISQALPGMELIPLWEFPDLPPVEELGTSFLENALKKARTACRKTDLPTVADDSGLVVDALGGRPGVCSARYAGATATDLENLEKLRLEMEAEKNRAARYVCILVFRHPDGREWVIEETCEGEIAGTPSGAGGFGYDPLFYLPEFGKTMAEIPLGLKNRISHRGKALERLRFLVASLGKD